MTPKTQYFNGLRFTRNEEGTYYQCSTLPISMHRYVWEYYNGPIPIGYEIHHIDFDKSNNDISNLQLMTIEDHKKLHASLLTDEQREWRRNNMNTVVRQKAIEWHKSDVGREWHKQQYERTKDKLHKKFTFICVNCGQKFIGEKHSKFCCNNCKSAYRRKSGTDSVVKNCIICGVEFTTNKYKQGVTCSRSCANKYMWRRRNESKDCKKD